MGIYTRAGDIRKNQARVNADGNKLDINRPDLQGTSPEGKREAHEWDRTQERSDAHRERIERNDPEVVCVTYILDDPC